MYKITKKELKALGVCPEGIVWFEEQKTEDPQELLSAAKKDGKLALGFWNWFLTKKMSCDQNIKYAIFSAKSVLDIFEAVVPGDDRPRKAIEAAEKYIEIKSEDAGADAMAAGAAAESAWSAADSAKSAAEAAWSAWSAWAAKSEWSSEAAAEAASLAARAAWSSSLAAGSAAEDAARVAGDSATWAAARAARAAAEAAAYSENLGKIIDYGFSLVFRG